MSYTHHTNQALNNELNETIAAIFELKQEFEQWSTERERLAVNRDLGIMYRRQFDIESEIQERGRELIRSDVYTILRQAANIMQNGQVTVHNGYDPERNDRYEVTLRLHELGVKDALSIFQELTHHWGQNVTFDNQFGVTEFYINITLDWAEVVGLK